MYKKQITEQDGTHKKWYVEAKEQTQDTLPEFIRHLTEDYGHDYGTICHAISAAAIAAATAVDTSRCGGITGFQGGAVMWEFITNWMMEYKDKPLKLVNYNNMLFPQYEDIFSKTISQETADYLKREALANLAEKDMANVSEKVVRHWKKLAGGHIPFGYSVRRT